MSLLFKELDAYGTISQVADLLGDDLERLLLQTGRRLTDLKSPQLSGMPSGSHNNYTEMMVINGLNAEAEVRAIHATIQHLPETSKQVLVGMFVDHHQWFQVSNKLFQSKSTLYRRRRQAMLEFADAFDYWQRVYHCEPIRDLHKYKKQRNEA